MKGNKPYRVSTEERKPTPLGEILSAAIRKAGLSEGMERHRILEREVWQRAVGERIAAVTRPRRLSYKTLYVSVSNHTWLQHLGFLHDRLIKNINEVLSGDLIKRIHFSLGDVDGNGPVRAALGPGGEEAGGIGGDE